ncbi:MAG: hypothetical protein RBS56_01085 [Candidatus Gracilibacteria bacterium]|jgi:hypothetical protein|nr:hypothetical protein [Candidatus Gracilibacteria bacterium]
MRKLIRPDNPPEISPQEAKDKLKESLLKILNEDPSGFSLMEELDLCLGYLMKIETNSSTQAKQAVFIRRLSKINEKVKAIHANEKFSKLAKYNPKSIDTFFLTDNTENIKPFLQEILGFIEDRSIQETRAYIHGSIEKQS